MRTISTLFGRYRKWMSDVRLRRMLVRIQMKMNGLKTGLVKN
jgi:hypothetical protein